MLTKPPLSNGQKFWAQVGWRVWSPDGVVRRRYTFWSWTDASGNFWVKNTDPAALGTAPNYQTYYDASYPRWRFRRGSTLIAAETAHWQPTEVQAMGETHTRASQMPGGYNSHVYLKGVHYWLNSSSVWQNINTTAWVNDGTIYGKSTPSSSRFEIWDKACST